MPTPERNKTTTYLSFIFRVGIAVLACLLIFKNTDIAELSHTFKRLSIFCFLVALAIFMGGLCLIGLRWWIFMRAQGISIPLQMAIKLTYLGQFFTNFMPSAVGGDLVRAWHISKFTDKKLQAALGVMADRLIGLLSTLILAVFGYLIFLRGRTDIFQAIRKESEGVGAIFDKISFSGPQMVLGVGVLLGSVLILSGLFDLTSFLKRFYGHVAGLLGHIKEVIGVYARYPLILIFGLGITVFLQCLVILSLWLIGRSLGIQVPIYFYFVFFPMMWVVSSLPLSVAGIGILEGGLVLLFVQFAGAEQEAATALAFCQRFIWALASLPGMVVHLTGKHRKGCPQC